MTGPTDLADCVIVVNSCDAYSDVWPLFFTAFAEHWSTNRIPIVVNTETAQLPILPISATVHHYSEDAENSNWGGRLLSTLSDQTADFVIMLFDDFILESDVDVSVLEDCIERMRADSSITVFYLINVPGAEECSSVGAGFSRLPRFANYRLNSAPAIWRRSSLIEFTRQCDSPWVWELFGTVRTYRKATGFFCVRSGEKAIYPYDYSMGGAIYRGRWVGRVVEPKLAKYRLQIDLHKRGITEGRDMRRSGYEKLRMLVAGFRAVGPAAIVVVFLLVISRLKQRRS